MNTTPVLPSAEEEIWRSDGVHDVLCGVQHGSGAAVVEAGHLVGCRRGERGAVHPRHVGKPALVPGAVVRAAPRGLGGEVQVAPAHGVAVRVRAALVVLALGAHRHGATPVSPAQPTEPSIWSSIRRLHSTAYSMGSVRVTGSMNPFTTMLMAASWVRPRDMR